MTNTDFTIPCANCKADLAGRDINGTCPACLRPIAETIHLGVVDTATGTVNCDIACGTCDYNLRTQLWNGRCPECAAPVAGSLDAGHLRFADAAWLRRVSRGITQLLAAMAGVPGLWILGFVLSSAIGSNDIALWIFEVCWGILIFTLLVAGVHGVALIAAREPRVRSTHIVSGWPRRLVRVVPYCSGPFIIVFLITSVFVPYYSISRYLDDLMLIALGTLPLSAFGGSLLLRRLCQRARRPRLGIFALIIAIIFGIDTGFVAIHIVAGHMRSFFYFSSTIDEVLAAAESTELPILLLGLNGYLFLLILLTLLRPRIARLRDLAVTSEQPANNHAAPAARGAPCP